MEKNNKTLEEVCKELRSKTDIVLDKNQYVMLMLDGHCFSKMIKKKFNLPFDYEFMGMMNLTAKYLMEKIQGCKFAYVQSDEITIVCTAFEEESTLPFGGRTCKLQSIPASMASKVFNYHYLNFLKRKTDNDDLLNKMVEFDCKAWNVPEYNDVYRYLVWRQRDCLRNSKNQAARAYFSHNRLKNLSADEQISLLKAEKDIDWNDYSGGFKYGRFLYKSEITLTNENNEPYTRNKIMIHDGFILEGKNGYDCFEQVVKIPKINEI